MVPESSNSLRCDNNKFKVNNFGFFPFLNENLTSNAMSFCIDNFKAGEWNAFKNKQTLIIAFPALLYRVYHNA